MTTTDKIIEKYLNFSGERNFMEFANFQKEVSEEKEKQQGDARNYKCLNYIEHKLLRGMSLCLQHEGQIDVIIEGSIEDIERGYDEPNLGKTKSSKRKKKAIKKTKPKKKKRGLGKLVDDGKVSPRGNSDLYWKKKGIDVVFKPNDERVRHGSAIPASYKYSDMRFLENYYGLRAFEFGNWLSQQDRVNYVSGLGLALFDLYPLLGFSPEKISLKGRLAVAFGARGRGKALAHFEPGSFTINLTRYSRPLKTKSRPANFRRVNLILHDGGVGAFAHEYGHALDYFGGLHAEKGDSFSLSGDKSINPKPNAVEIKKNTLHGLMEKLLYKIIWKDSKTYSDYYKRLLKASSKKYYKQRNEIFARAFEVYIQHKLSKSKHKNIFLNNAKYDNKFYLSSSEMKKIEPEFDALMRALKKHL